MKTIGNQLSKVKAGITLFYFLLVALYFSPLSVGYKGVFPLAFLTLCSLFFSSPAMTVAMFFSALGDYMGICHNFWGQMISFALAHVAFSYFFLKKSREERWVLDSMIYWTIIIVVSCLYWIMYLTIAENVEPFTLRVGVMVYTFLILFMYWSACQQSNLWYVIGAVLFIFSDFMLGWNKFTSPVDNIRYWIMIPYLCGQWLLFIQSVCRKRYL